MTEAIELESVTKRYGDVTAVRDVSLKVQKGEVFGILGPSGAGKSTILRIMDLLEPPDQGKIRVSGASIDLPSKTVSATRSRIGMVLQKPVVLNRSVRNNLAYPLALRGWNEEDIAKKVDSEMRSLGLYDRRMKNARTLSGGEMQRLCFSRATIFEPEILLLDEFAANLDPANVSLLEDQVRSFKADDRSRAVVVVTHNLFQAKRMCSRVGLMWDGKFVEIADTEKFFEDPDDERTAAFVKGELVY